MNAYTYSQHVRETIKLKNPQEKKHETEYIYIFFLTLAGKLVGLGYGGDLEHSGCVCVQLPPPKTSPPPRLRLRLRTSTPSSSVFFAPLWLR